MFNQEALLQDFFIYVPVVDSATTTGFSGGDEATAVCAALPPGHDDWVKIPLDKGLIVYARMPQEETSVCFS